MTGDDIREARATLGKLWKLTDTQGEQRPLHTAELARLLRLGGRDPGRSVIDWEKGKTKITGPVSVAIEMMLAGHEPPTREEAIRE